MTTAGGAREALFGSLVVRAGLAGEEIAEGDEETGSDGVLDMSALHGASSTTVGLTVAVHLRFAEAGKRLRIRLNPKLLKLFELTMLTDTLSLEMLGEGEDPRNDESGGQPRGKSK